MTPLTRQFADLFHPLADFYSEQDVMSLHIQPIEGDAVPAPYHDLLVHEKDMTSTLEAHFDTTFRLHVLDKHVETSQLTRQVVLVSEADDRPVEFGAIRIRLDRFEGALRETIVACKRPLGSILNEAGLAFHCHPNAYFTFQSDEIAQRAFQLDEGHILYGRHNRLVDGDEAILAEVVEILPPLPAVKGEA